jgi:hypothetical protein
MNCIKNKNKELEILTFLDNKFKYIDSNLKTKIYGVLKHKELTDLKDINYAIENLRTTYIIEKQKLNKLVSTKDNIHKYLESVKNNYIKQLEHDINPELQCQICYDNRLNIVLNPCGHMFCNNCFSSDKNTCFNCRVPVISVINVYN